MLNMRRKTKEDFINSAIIKHGDKYDYSKVEYVNNCTKVCIICPEHGEFWQTPSSHLQGNGCMKCSIKNKPQCNGVSKDDFISKANKIHNNKYDYSKVEYVNTMTDVCIICPEHGEFYQRPNNHLNGKGCRKCSNERHKFIQTSTTKEFIEKSNNIHNKKYDYSKVCYCNQFKKVCIICPKHGEFWQTPKSHLRGQGCPICKSSKIEDYVAKILSETQIEFERIKRFPEWLGLQSLDFYLPKYNIAIECQGGQHFFPVEGMGGEQRFKKQIERDKRKAMLCKNNGIRLFYYTNVIIDDYPYDVYTNIDKLIIKIKNEQEKTRFI